MTDTPAAARPRTWDLVSTYSFDRDAMKWSVSRETEVTKETESAEKISVVEKSHADQLEKELGEVKRERANILEVSGERIKNLQRERSEYLAELQETRSALARKTAAIEICKDILNNLAAWKDGSRVGSHFDDPAGAELARNGLAELEACEKGDGE